MNSLPIFYHIAKSAGTYVINALDAFYNNYDLSDYLGVENRKQYRINRQLVNFANGNMCTMFSAKFADFRGVDDYNLLFKKLHWAEIASVHHSSLDPEKYPHLLSKKTFSQMARGFRKMAVHQLNTHCKQVDHTWSYVDFQNLAKELDKKLFRATNISSAKAIGLIAKKKIQPLFIAIEPQLVGTPKKPAGRIGWDVNFEFIDAVSELIQKPIRNYCTLRHPYGRAQSLYNYLTSDASNHEGSHKSIVSPNFIEYITSGEIEDCLLIRNIGAIPWSQPISKKHYNRALKKLGSDCVIKPSRLADKLLEELFKNEYKADFHKFKKENHSHFINMNRNKNDLSVKLDYEQLDSHVKNKFNKYTKWDLELYEHYCK